MTQLVIQGTGVADTDIHANDPNTNFGSVVYIGVGEDNTEIGYLYRTLLQFDLSDIPAGSTINSATLTLTLYDDRSNSARTLSVYRVLRNWVESEATWNVYSTGNGWGTAGCANTTTDREASAIGTQTQPATGNEGDTLSVTLTASKIEEMISGGVFTNNGFLLQVDTESDDAWIYYSTEFGTPSKRPKLTIDYTPPPSGFFAIL